MKYVFRMFMYLHELPDLCVNYKGTFSAAPEIFFLNPCQKARIAFVLRKAKSSLIYSGLDCLYNV